MREKVSAAMKWQRCRNPEYLKRTAGRWHAYRCKRCGEVRTVSWEWRTIVKRIGSSSYYIYHHRVDGVGHWMQELQRRYRKPLERCVCPREP
jgi:hypothetical protein